MVSAGLIPPPSPLAAACRSRWLCFALCFAKQFHHNGLFRTNITLLRGTTHNCRICLALLHRPVPCRWLASRRWLSYAIAMMSLGREVSSRYFCFTKHFHVDEFYLPGGFALQSGFIIAMSLLCKFQSIIRTRVFLCKVGIARPYHPDGFAKQSHSMKYREALLRNCIALPNRPTTDSSERFVPLFFLLLKSCGAEDLDGLRQTPNLA